MYDIDKHSNISWQAVFRYISLTPTHQTLENQMHGKWIDVHILRWNENEKPMQKGQGERNIHEKSSICELPYHFVIFCDILWYSWFLQKHPQSKPKDSKQSHAFHTSLDVLEETSTSDASLANVANVTEIDRVSHTPSDTLQPDLGS